MGKETSNEEAAETFAEKYLANFKYEIDSHGEFVYIKMDHGAVIWFENGKITEIFQ